jgi:hypothetical protein
MALNLPLREDPGAKPVGTAPPTGTRTVFIVDVLQVNRDDSMIVSVLSDVFPPLFIFREMSFLLVVISERTQCEKFIISFSYRIALGWAEFMHVSRASRGQGRRALSWCSNFTSTKKP